MSTKTTKPAPKTSKTTAAKGSDKTPSPSKTNGNKGKKPAAKSTLTAAVSTPTSKIVAPKTVPYAKTMGTYLDTQMISERIGRNWQFVNRQRHAGAFIDHVAVLKGVGTYLYRASDVREWAKSRGLPFGRN